MRAWDWLVRDPRTGRRVIVQAPNSAVAVWLLGAAGARLGLGPRSGEVLGWIGTGALIAWAADELIRGVNPLRRLLGASVLAWQAWRLAG